MRRRARSFGAVADRYDRVRPGYPPGAVEWTLEPLGPPSATRPWRVVDLGAGTGLLTRQLAASGAAVVAVEPDPAMRAVLSARRPDLDVRPGRAEAVPLGDAEADAVLGAQMWHWVDPGPAAAEVARVLRPGGVLGLLWNQRDERTAWMAEFGRIVGGEDAHTGPVQVALAAGAPFGPGAHHDVAWSHELAVADLVDLAATRSQLQVRPRAERDAVLARVASLAAHHPALAGRERVPVPYVTACWRAVRAR